MDNKQRSMRDAMEMAKSPAGQQLIQRLQQQGGEKVRLAMEKAASGDLSQIGIIFAVLKDDPEAKKLLEQLGGAHGQHGR